MRVENFFRFAVLCAVTPVLFACEQIDLSRLSATALAPASGAVSGEKPNGTRQISELGALINNSRLKVDVDGGFTKALSQALDQDPSVLASKSKLVATKEKLRFTKTGADTQISSTLLGGFEDVTDKTGGVAAILTADRMIYDGGMLKAKVDGDTFILKAAEFGHLAALNDRAKKLSGAWIELERYQDLKVLIDGRLAVLDPLLNQLEQVAAAGVGDVSQVAAAQRLVSSILVAQNEVSAKYQQSRTSFQNGFGVLPSSSKYDSSWVSKLVPASNVKVLVEKSPGLLSKFWEYRAAEASIIAIKAQDNFNVGFQMKLQRPFGGSEVGSSESIGLAVAKNFYRGDQLDSQVKRAEATAQALSAEVSARYRESEHAIMSAQKMIESMDKAIALSRKNAESSLKELEFLRKQLVIGGSTLESVLTAEVRLYDAESKEIGFIAERRKAEVTIAAVTGFLAQTIISN